MFLLHTQLQVMSLLKLPLSREFVYYHGNITICVLDSCHGQIATLLTDLGYSQAEVGLCLYRI